MKEILKVPHFDEKVAMIDLQQGTRGPLSDATTDRWNLIGSPCREDVPRDWLCAFIYSVSFWEGTNGLTDVLGWVILLLMWDIDVGSLSSTFLCGVSWALSSSP